MDLIETMCRGECCGVKCRLPESCGAEGAFKIDRVKRVLRALDEAGYAIVKGKKELHGDMHLAVFRDLDEGPDFCVPNLIPAALEE